jgi:hypothetical protein
VPLQERVRDLFGSASSKPSTTNMSASSPSAADPPAADLAIAQGHELLGPCRDCTGYWTRELTRGQKPLTCPVCKRLGPPA